MPQPEECVSALFRHVGVQRRRFTYVQDLFLPIAVVLQDFSDEVWNRIEGSASHDHSQMLLITEGRERRNGQVPIGGLPGTRLGHPQASIFNVVYTNQ